MIEERIGALTVKRYDDIDELKIRNYNLFNECALYDSNIGSFEAIPAHFQKIDYYFSIGKIDDAYQARKNVNEVFVHIMQHNNFPALQWAATVHTIDEKEVTDLSIDGMKRLINALSDQGLTQKKVKADVDELKKKFGINYGLASRNGLAMA